MASLSLILILTILIWFCEVDLPLGGALISNVNPRLDTDGNILNAHDGNVQQWDSNGDFFWYSIGYSNCTEPQATTNGCEYASVNNSCGFQYNHTINLYISSNLTSGMIDGIGCTNYI